MPITEGGRFTPNDRIVSPGVFSRENDLSGIAQGVADIGGVVVSPFSKGPGFSPTLVRSVAELESKFGVADGTLYGPYTAKQYLQEKGFVTVCRVGALTGYHQRYPWVIWAEKGTWLRAPDEAYIVTSESILSQTGLTFSTAGQNTSASVHSYTGSVNFVSQSVTLVLSGSTLYNGTSVVGNISGKFNFTGSLNLSTASATSESILQAIFDAGLFTGSVDQAFFSSTQTPFNMVVWTGGFVSQSLDSCGNLELNVGGLLTGSIGNYNGNFTSGSGTFDPCTGTWTFSGTEYKVLAVLADTQNATINSQLQAPGFLGSTQSYDPSPSGSDSVSLAFDLALSQSSDGGYGVYNFSLNPNNIKYITNVFGKNPQAGDPSKFAAGTKREAAYLYKIFEDDIASIANDPTSWRIHGDAMPSGSWSGEALQFTDQYSLDLINGDSDFGLTNAATPWVVSQQISPFNGGNATRFPLFKLLTLNDGTRTNTSYKIEVSNVKLAGTVAGSDWGSFTLTVRDYSDTDKKPKVLEQFSNLNLDPTSPNFIARRIGDRYNYIRFDGKIIEFGTYDNLSSLIRVEVADNPYPTSAVPYGFQAYVTPVNGALGQQIHAIGYTKASIYGLFPGRYPSGVDFNGPPPGADSQLTSLYPTSSIGVEHWRDNLQYFAPIPVDATVGNNTVFALDSEITDNGVTTGSYISASNVVPATFDAANENTYVKMRKFIFGFQGGFDGQSPAIPLNIGGNIVAGNTQGLNCASSTTAGSIAYNQCIGALGNADEFDINLIVTPGIIYSLHSYVTTITLEMCERRGDCFYIPDLYLDDGNPTDGQIDEVVNLAKEFDTSYAGTYYPWIKIKDTNINQIVTVPPSVVMPAIYAANDRVAGEWFAAAGLNRGGITQAVQVTDRTTHTERDSLYEGRVNPIAAFPGQGIVAWGQKTLQVESSALDRINVRRLLIEIKKFFASTARFFVFEQNTAATRNKFLAIVNPFLESVQQRSGLFAFQVVMDESNNTPDLIDRNILYGQIWLKPTKTAEFIVLDFNILATGASFPSA
jgi:hypothetical protein